MKKLPLERFTELDICKFMAKWFVSYSPLFAEKRQKEQMNGEIESLCPNLQPVFGVDWRWFCARRTSGFPPEFTQMVCNSPPLERSFNCSMVELLTIGADLLTLHPKTCSLETQITRALWSVVIYGLGGSRLRISCSTKSCFC